MSKPHMVFGSLQVILAVLGAAWSGLILLNLLASSDTRTGITHILNIHDAGSTTVLFWTIGNGIYAVMAFIAGLLVAARHPDAKGVSIFAWCIFVLSNGPFVWQSLAEPSSAWYIVVPVAGILFIGQTAMFGYRRSKAMVA